MRHLLTEEDIQKLKEEIEYRKVVTRKQINEDLKEARAHGDLSENFEYKAAKKERGRNEGRIRYLERMIKTSTVIKDTTLPEEVGLEKTVSIYFLEDDFSMDIKLVTTVETDAINQKVSIESPLGKAIFRKRVGDVVNVSSPDGEYQIRIDTISSNN